MTHYVCTGGCGAVSDKPGTCQAENCPLHGHHFVECHCADGLHKEAFEKAARDKKKK